MKKLLVLCLALAFLSSAISAEGQSRKIVDGLYLYPDSCNVYVFLAEGKALLVDIGSGSVLGKLEEKQIPVECVVATDFQRDHVAGARLLEKKGVPLKVSERLEFLFTDVEPWWKHAGNPGTFYTRDRLRSSVKVASLLKEGEKIKFGDWMLSVLDTPGHSDGSITIIARRGENSFALTGDLLVAPGKLPRHYGVGQMGFGVDQQVNYLSWYIGSLDKIAAASPNFILPSHGEPMERPIKVCDDLRQKLADVRKLTDFWRSDMWMPGWSQPSKYGKPKTVKNAVPANRKRLDASPKYRGSVPPHEQYSKKLGKHTELTPHFIWFPHGGQNMYALLSDAGEAFIFDGGSIHNGFSQRDFEELQKCGIKKISACAPTHFHSDHVGGEFYMTNELKAELWAHEKMADVLDNPFGHELPWHIKWPLKVERTIKEGEKVKWNEYELQFFWQPGHTRYAQGIFFEVDGKRVAVCGDNILGSEAGTPGYITPFNRSGVQALSETVARVKKFKPDWVVGGHSYVCDDPSAGLEKLAKWAQDMTVALQKLVALPSVKAMFDPYWARFYPYSARLKSGKEIPLSVKVTNYFAESMDVELSVHTPEGVTYNPEKHKGSAPSKNTIAFGGTLQVGKDVKPGLHVLAADMTVNGEKMGEVAVMVLRVEEED
ncbi:MBL fold metallo-hydrolase [Candidatus Hydrogenedentota bacterium]